LEEQDALRRGEDIDYGRVEKLIDNIFSRIERKVTNLRRRNGMSVPLVSQVIVRYTDREEPPFAGLTINHGMKTTVNLLKRQNTPEELEELTRHLNHSFQPARLKYPNDTVSPYFQYVGILLEDEGTVVVHIRASGYEHASPGHAWSVLR
jgi:hypothetical protein